MKLRVLLLLLAVVSAPVHADDDASTLERMGYTKDWLEANGYSSYQEYRDHQRQMDLQRQKAEAQLQIEGMRLAEAQARRAASMAQWQARQYRPYWRPSYWRRPIFVRHIGRGIRR